MKYNFKIIIVGFIILYAIITLLFFYFYRSLAIKDTKEEALSTLNTILSIRSFMKDVQRPILDAWQKESNVTIDFDAHIFSSSYITQYIYDNRSLESKLKYEYKLVATNPLNPIHKANVFEADILEKFRKNQLEDYFSLIKENGNSYFYIAVPISRNQESCLRCHGNPKDSPAGMVEQYGNTSGYYEKVGDLRAMISLKIALMDILKYHKQEFISGGIAMFIVFIVFILLLYVISKQDKVLDERKEKLFFQQNRLAVMGGMIGNISHQWKQPLTHLSYILINLNLLYKRDKLTDEKLTEKISEANEQIAYMSETINDFKNFFSPQVVQKNLSIVEIIEQAKRLLLTSLKNNNIALDIQIENNFLFFGNPNELVQVLVNIINNAKEAFLSQSNLPYSVKRTITIFTCKEVGKNVVRIENNAGEIDEKIINNIFEPYFSTKDLAKATGIGLYICKTIIERAQGTLSVSNIPNGVSFIIKF